MYEAALAQKFYGSGRLTVSDNDSDYRNGYMH